MRPDTAGGATTTRQRFKDLMEEIKLADEAGLDVFGIGEHHRADYAVSSPSVVLGAAAAVTKQIRLSSAVTVLSSDDPVRVFQQFATVDQISGGRAELMVGRGSFIESFPLFGYDLSKYDELFSEKLELLLKINRNEILSWNGKLTPSVENRGVYPRPLQPEIPVWLAVGGTPSSAVRAGTLGLPMMIAIIGGEPARFKGFTDLYRASAEKAGHDVTRLQLGLNFHSFITENSQDLRSQFYPGYMEMMNRIGRERGWPPVTAAHLDGLAAPEGSLFAGSPQQVIDKILAQHELFGNTRFLAHMSLGTVPHAAVMKSIELYATRVVPEIRKTLNTKL